MKKIMLTALSCAVLAVCLGWLVTMQANASSAQNSASLLIALISIPLLLASVVFSVGAAWVLRSKAQRRAHQINTRGWQVVWGLNMALALFYLFGIAALLQRMVNLW